MKKYWLLKKKAPHLIAISDNAIISGSIKKHDKNQLLGNLERGVFPDDIFSIPFSYIKSVENSNGQKTITVNYGKESTENIETGDEKLNKEIFNLIRNTLITFDYSKKKPSIYQHAKPQIFAILIVSGLFLWSFYYANEISKGYEYTMKGSGVGISGIALGIAQFGKTKVIAAYLCLISIAGFSLYKKLSNRTLIEYLTRNKN